VARYGLRRVTIGPVRFTAVQRRAIRDRLAPHLPDPSSAEAVVTEVEALAPLYLMDSGSGWNEPEEPRKRQLEELTATLEAAHRLLDALDRMGAAARDRLDESLTAWVDRKEPPEWAGDAPAAVRYLAERVEQARARLAQEPRQKGRPSNLAAYAFANDLARVWCTATGQALPRGNADARSPWGRFVAAVFKAIDPDVGAERVARRVATVRARTSRTK